MSFPGQILVATAIASTLVAGASSAPERVKSLGPGDRVALAGLPPGELRELVARIDTATEVQIAIERLGLAPEAADLSVSLQRALASLRASDDPLRQPVSADQVDRLRSAARGLAQAEIAARSARGELVRALASL